MISLGWLLNWNNDFAVHENHHAEQRPIVAVGFRIALEIDGVCPKVGNHGVQLKAMLKHSDVHDPEVYR